MAYFTRHKLRCVNVEYDDDGFTIYCTYDDDDYYIRLDLQHKPMSRVIYKKPHGVVYLSGLFGSSLLCAMVKHAEMNFLFQKARDYHRSESKKIADIERKQKAGPALYEAAFMLRESLHKNQGSNDLWTVLTDDIIDKFTLAMACVETDA